MMSNSYGLLSAGSSNLGDEIQAIAARQFLPRVDRFVMREALNRDPGGAGSTKLIMNGWYMAKPSAWPPHPRLIPHLTSLHFSQHRPSRRRFWLRPPAEVMLSTPGRRWLDEHGPVGARDHATLALLLARGVESFYSGCLTLTLAPRPGVPATDHVIASDLPATLLDALARRTGPPPIAVTHLDRATDGVERRLARANRLLDLYAGAKAVITTRLHCALPCLALGTPVLFIPVQPDRYRLQPALDLAHHCSAEEFLDGGGFDPEKPPPNPARHLLLAEALGTSVRGFIAEAV